MLMLVLQQHLNDCAESYEMIMPSSIWRTDLFSFLFFWATVSDMLHLLPLFKTSDERFLEVGCNICPLAAFLVQRNNDDSLSGERQLGRY